MQTWERELKPLCAICQKEVDSIEAIQDFRTGSIVFVVKCHGDNQIVTTDKAFFMDNKVERGIAFINEPKKLEII